LDRKGPLRFDDPLIFETAPGSFRNNRSTRPAAISGAGALIRRRPCRFFAFKHGGLCSTAGGGFSNCSGCTGLRSAAIDPAWKQIAQAAHDWSRSTFGRTDFGYGAFGSATCMVVQWLEAMWPQWQRPLLYIATDDHSVLEDFGKYRPPALLIFQSSRRNWNLSLNSSS